MSEIKQKIITVDAKAFFKYFPKEIAEDQKCFTLKYTNRALYKLVVQQENEMEDCPLFHQFFKEIEKSWNPQTNDEPFKITNTTLFDKFVIVDFGDIFLPLDEISSFPGQKERHEDYLENAKDIVENGFDIYFKNHEKPVHMIAFDKSGNMSRHSRISFIDENYYAGLNTRLNLGMDFSKIPVKESKYYSYRGLYLSSSKRINHKKLIIDADTIVVLHDVRKDEKNPSKPITGYYYDKGITIATAKLDVEEERDKESLCISAKGCKKKAKFQIPAKGTYINELPVYFENELKKYQSSKEKIKDTSSFFAYPRKISSEDKKKIEKFKKQCKMVLEYYFFYVQTFLILLKNEKKDKFYAPENLQTNLFQIYDEKNAIHIERTIVPNIKRKIRPYVDENNTIKDMKDRMNEVQWLLQPYDNRGKALEQIIGNGFNESSLDEEEREVLYHFYQHCCMNARIYVKSIYGIKSQASS